MRFSDPITRNPDIRLRSVSRSRSVLSEAFKSEPTFTIPNFDNDEGVGGTSVSLEEPQRLEEFMSVPEVVPFGIRRGSRGLLLHRLFLREVNDDFSQPTIITSHADLDDLDGVDDHDFYYPADGSRPLTGHVDLGSSGRIFKYNGDEVLTLQGKLNPTDPFIRIANADSGTAPEISVQGGNADLKLAARGSNATFSIDVSTYRIKNVVDPSGAQDAATKNYVDAGTTNLVTGPGSSTNNAIARYNGDTGKVIQNSVVLISDSGILSGAARITVDNLQLDGNQLKSTSGNLLLRADTGANLQITVDPGQPILFTAEDFRFNFPLNVDGTITLISGASTGAFTWMEDEARLDFDSDCLIGTDKKIYLRDTGIFIHSNADGELTIEADGKVLVTGTLALSDSASKPPLNVTERSAEPSSPVSGDIYLDDGTNTGSGNPGWRRYTGAAWEDLGKESQTAEYDNGNSGASKTIDWGNGRHQKITLTADCTFTFTNPTALGMYYLRLIFDATGGWDLTWPASSILEWVSGAAPAWSTGISAKDLAMFHYHGSTKYWGAGLIDFG